MNTIIGEEGLLKKASSASEESRGASIEEQVNLWKAEIRAGKYLGGTTKSVEGIVESLKEQGLLKASDAEWILNETENPEMLLEIGSRKEDKAISFKTEDTGEIKAGDYVSYNPTSVTLTNTSQIIIDLANHSGYTGTDYNKVDSNVVEARIRQENLKWRVLDKTPEGGIRLISETPTESMICLRGFINLRQVELLDDFCSELYGNLSVTSNVQNLKIEDIENKKVNNQFIKEIYNTLFFRKVDLSGPVPGYFLSSIHFEPYEGGTPLQWMCGIHGVYDTYQPGYPASAPSRLRPVVTLLPGVNLVKENDMESWEIQ